MSRWEQFLKETIQDEKEIRLLQEFFGYCLMDHANYGKCLVLYGRGSGGISTLMSILVALVDEKNCSYSDLNGPFSVACLEGKKLNFADELSPWLMESETFKNLLHGDLVRAERMHRDSILFQFTGKLVFGVNHFPHKLNKDDGLFHRLIVVRFRRQFLGNDADPSLRSKLIENLDLILGWALEGHDRLINRGGF